MTNLKYLKSKLELLEAKGYDVSIFKKLRVCTVCKETKETEKFVPDKKCYLGYSFTCKRCINKKALERYHEGRYVNNRLKYRYGIINEEYEQLLINQKFKYAICKIHQSDLTNQQKLLYIDHDHTTNKVRGLLCPKCNSALGYIEDSNLIDAAIEYLKRSKAL